MSLARLSLLVLASSFLFGCSGAAPAPEPPALPVRAEWSPPRPGPIVSVSPGPALVVGTVEGAEAARVRAIFASASGAVRACRPGSGGVLHLTLDTRNGRTQYTVGPSSAIEPRAQRCVTEALSAVDLQGISGDPSPSARPSGFTAHLRVEW